MLMFHNVYKNFLSIFSFEYLKFPYIFKIFPISYIVVPITVFKMALSSLGPLLGVGIWPSSRESLTSTISSLVSFYKGIFSSIGLKGEYPKELWLTLSSHSKTTSWLASSPLDGIFFPSFELAVSMDGGEIFLCFLACGSLILILLSLKFLFGGAFPTLVYAWCSSNDPSSTSCISFIFSYDKGITFLTKISIFLSRYSWLKRIRIINASKLISLSSCQTIISIS